MKYAISCILMLLTAKKTHRYGDSIAYCCVSHVLERTPHLFAPARLALLATVA